MYQTGSTRRDRPGLLGKKLTWACCGGTPHHVAGSAGSEQVPAEPIYDSIRVLDWAPAEGEAVIIGASLSDLSVPASRASSHLFREHREDAAVPFHQGVAVISASPLIS
jgi:hypothetical protein